MTHNCTCYIDGTGSYRISIYTGDKLFAGTDAKVHIEIFGEKGGTGNSQLHCVNV